MASVSAVLTSEEEYLHTSYRPDCDYVDGYVLERNLGQYDHSHLQGILVGIFFMNRSKWSIQALPEQRLKVRSGKYRITDLMIVRADYDVSEKVTRTPPLLCIEILSPDDRFSRILERCWEYNDMGVPAWIFDPESKVVFVASDRSLSEVTTDVLRCGAIEVSCSDVFSML